MSLDITLRMMPKWSGEEYTKNVEDGVEVFQANITHNLSRMAEEAGIPLWDRSLPGKKASFLFARLVIGLSAMNADPQHFKRFDAKNGWGTYEDFIPWLRKLRDACNIFPDAIIEINR